ncbi:hypothetical protein HII36_46200 [Nonomuraea sp. NN258]|uniref:hypothetical protein n=1 Tax=Nonomuraea antri TaxID=2730852 RepID=UPI0015699928|nr:hypothetical protein [Nonomuraea antri]NRQ39166.1 hypothetical protein [Nonomuraea antri]
MATHASARIDVERVLQHEAEPAPADRAELVAGVLPRGVLFATEPAGTARAARDPQDEWRLVSAWHHQGRLATGTAHVHLAPGNRGLTRPMIFADGFNHGPSDLPGLWNHLNAPQGNHLLDRLLAAGIDVVLLGFDVRHDYLQANAGVAVSCIQRAITERLGGDALTVGGVSMGGMVTRYALAAMEERGQDHQTDTYLSLDTPHNGAWIPLILQQLAYFSETLAPGPPPAQADLIRSPAAQQLLWGWVESAGYSGEVATASPLRAAFLDDLRRMGWFPQRPRKLGVANGAGDGTGANVPPDELVFEWSTLAGAVGATARTQPDHGTHRHVGGMRAIPMWASRSYTTGVPAFDGAPGGTLASYGMLADKLGVPIEERFRSTCFVPSVSAVALNYDPVDWPIDLYTNLSALPPDRSDLDDFHCDGDNGAHGTVTPALAEWILAHLTK